MRKYLSVVLICGSLLCGFAQPNYNFARLQRERIGRGLVAIRKSPAEVILSWRYLSSDPLNTAFNVYRDGARLNKKPLVEGTFFSDNNPNSTTAVYEVRPEINGVETHHLDGKYSLPQNAPTGCIEIPIRRPSDGVTPTGDKYSYSAGDASIGDVDGDGEYEIILEWEPSNSRDNSFEGYTGPVYYDCYRLNGQHLWRIDLGRNISAGSHYLAFMVYDLDGDGKAEVVMRTSDGTVDGKGHVIGDANADYREKGELAKTRKNKQGKDTPFLQGRILSGNEYLTVFSGLTGEALKTINYTPPRGNIADWGDSYGNRVDRFLACVANLDGIHPSVVMCRGYYTRTVLVAYDWDGKELKQRWIFDSNQPENKNYAGQGNHNLRVGDVDGDSCDEIVYGSCTIDHNGKGLYTTGLEHGDAMHLTKFDLSLKGLQVWACHENGRDGSTLRDAATGKVLVQVKSSQDVGRCMAADIDPVSPGVEMWSTESGGILNVKGQVIAPRDRSLPISMAVWWDDDLLRELLNRNTVSKYDRFDNKCKTIFKFEGCEFNHGTKSNPCLLGDILGDWREEVLVHTLDNSALRLYVSPITTKYRFHTFLEDPVYRFSMVTQNSAYNQPTQPGFYFGPDLMKCTFRGYLFK